MSKQIWSPDLIAGEIRRLSAAGHELMQSKIAAIDSRLTSAAVRYFGSWGAAVAAAGVDYSRVAAAGREMRAAKITKWSSDSILREILALHEAGEDLSSAVIRRKHLALYATARRKEHFGSWAAAVAAAGIDYASVKRRATERRRSQAKWKKQLLVDRSATPPACPVADQSDALPIGAEPDPATSGDPEDLAILDDSRPQWWRGLLLEKLAEAYERPSSELADVTMAFKHLISRPGGEQSAGE